MREIIFGTSNKAKLLQVKGACKGLKIDIKGLDGFENLPEIIEDGKSAMENAEKKALGFAMAISKIVFSMDNALYLDGLSDDEQPGINVRRIKGVSGRPTDDQLVEHYSNLVKCHGGKMTGHWDFAIAVASPQRVIKKVVAKTPTRYFKAKPSSKIVAGYPLESLQVDPKTGKYISEMTQEEQDKFWQDTIGIQVKKLFSELFDDK